MKEHQNSKINPKRGNSAESSTLLLSALRPRLGDVDRIRLNCVGRTRLGCMGTVAAGIALMGGIYCGISNISSASATSVTLTVPESINVNVNPSADNGYAESTDNQVAISTGNQAGYTLSIKAKDSTNSNDLVNEQDKSSKLTSITESLTADQYKNGAYVNTWGFKSDVVNSQANSNYLPGPTTDGILLAKTNSNNKDGDTFKFAIATKVNNEVAAGNYSNNFVLTATGNTLKYTIRFNNNGGTGGPAAPQEGTIGDADLEVQINSETPTMQGKDFLGWCTKQPKEDGSCTGVVVQPAGCFPLCKCDLNITLYAMYGTKSGSGGGSGFNSGNDWTDCSSSGYDGPAKSFGGYCWMWKDYKTSRTWEEAKSDCPAGWHLPSRAEFQKLTGIMSDSRLFNNGWSGLYWSTTPGSSTNAYSLNVDGSSATVYFNGTTSTPKSVRCVAG